MRRLYLDKNLQLVFGVTLMAILGVSSIIPALPDMITGLGISPVHIGLVISAFTLPGALFAPLVGILADRLGRKAVLVPGLFIFGVFGFACFFAENIEQLLVLRFCQGIGASPLGVLYGTIIGDLYQGRDRGRAMGYNASVLSMGTAGFPAIGGVLAMLGWQYPFILPLLAIPLGLTVLARLDAPEPKSSGSFGEYLAGAWVRIKTRQVLALFATTLMTFMVLYGPIITYLPILLSHKFQASPLMIGLIFLIASGFSGIASFLLGPLAERFGQRRLLMASALFYMLSMVLTPDAPGLWHVIPPVICFGLGQGLNIPTVMTMLAGIAPMEQRGAFMAANGLLLRLAQTLAPLLMGGLYALYGMTGVFLGGLACAVSILLLAIFLVQE
ncbi:MAG: MFS transporter [Pseudodesulfovibrio sp.]|uniref:Major facilitator superfamily MFS_1 n=1 Tax=Pseudodesulfovibrio aespoeensis (strain ATCC 700646 / DSM 10631 / Aspo-2) TaxID=643562 RepID=E6VY61_PSEA9|nr:MULTISPECIES: MFS transporter [Pseudodesulfovibrio]MBU4190817.1 MFS transporter [Pseudomonadota bacterium]ADU63875.1 major facilitator superfamily MFS_1 [Pseudodesulfovibrio aespoeensis Aspo-2]MBU4243778.1 MFS transporter [Pseudomonadota bacterium]MBU4378554.1 MFS transporter [Pseudomonadota bacterium]MBU4475713.1 MFS transporter [Pseudomonadota bacterium]